MIRVSKELKNKTISGNVHSIFDTTINLLFNNKLITILNENKILLPNSIILKKTDFINLKRKILIGDNFVLKNNNLKIKNFIFKLTDFEKNFYLPILKSKLDELYSILKRHINMENYRIIFNENNLEKIINDFLNMFEKNIIVKFLIGRGFGLTPTGDDILNGMIFYFNLKKINKKVFYNEVKFNLIKTNIFSQNMLEYTIKNYYNEFFYYITTKSKNNLEKIILKRYGSTSGLDTVFGILLAAKIGNAL